MKRLAQKYPLALSYADKTQRQHSRWSVSFADLAHTVLIRLPSARHRIEDAGSIQVTTAAMPLTNVTPFTRLCSVPTNLNALPSAGELVLKSLIDRSCANPYHSRSQNSVTRVIPLRSVSTQA
jgi:hypothetical protein